MSEEAPPPSSLREVKQRLQDVRALERRARKRLGADVLSELATLQANVVAALEAGELGRAGSALGALEAFADKHLAFARKSKTREYVESIGTAVLIALFLRTFVLEPFQIPSGSMRPTLLEGDRLFVLKFSHGIRVPLSTRYVVRWRAPERGDIVVFVWPAPEILTQLRIRELQVSLARYRDAHARFPSALEDLALGPSTLGSADERLRDGWGRPLVYALEGQEYRLVSAGRDGRVGTADDWDQQNVYPWVGDGGCLGAESLQEAKDYIKRIVAVAGDRVAMVDNTLFVNGEPVVRRNVRTVGSLTRFGWVEREAAEESFDGERVWTTHVVGVRPHQAEWTVQEGHFFVVGDNRDDSADSRCWGEVPESNIKGSAWRLFFSRDPFGNEGVRWNRFLRRLQ